MVIYHGSNISVPEPKILSSNRLLDATVQLYETGLLSEVETIIRLKVEQIYDQILFHTEKALAFLKFTNHYIAGEKPIG